MDLPDVTAWIKVVKSETGKVVAENEYIYEGHPLVVRYVVTNDSHLAATVNIVGALYRNGIKVTPAGQPNVVPAQKITVQPNTIWKFEYPVKDAGDYKASILSDIGNSIVEEDDSNNAEKVSFTILTKF